MQESNGSSLKIKRVIFFIAFVLPLLGMANCNGWNEGTMTVKSCVIDGQLFRGYANVYYAFLLMSAFTVFIPIYLYVRFFLFLSKRFDKTHQKPNQPNQPKPHDSKWIE